MTDESLRILFRALGAMGLITGSLPGMFPLSARLALILSFPILFAGSASTAETVRLLSGEQPLLHFFPEILTGVLVALPICLGCWAAVLGANWFAELCLPQSSLWFLNRKNFDGANPAPRLKSLVVAFVVLTAINFAPYLPDLFARLADSIFRFPPISDAQFTGQLLCRRTIILSSQLAFVSAMSLALPVIGVSLAFDAAAALLARYMKPLRADSALWALRVLVIGAALAASLYSFTEMVDRMTKDGASARRQTVIEQAAEPK